jgi:hypothetical protein
LDPFSAIHNRLWAVLEAVPQITAAVPERNRVKADRRGPAKTATRSGLAALLDILPAPGGGGSFKSSSSSATFVQNFVIRLRTPDPELTRTVFPLKWRILSALANAGDNLGLGFVTQIALVDLDEPLAPLDGTTDPDEDPAPPGWAAVVGVSVRFNVSTAELMSAAVPAAEPRT